jgi:hypothetical protein
MLYIIVRALKIQEFHNSYRKRNIITTIKSERKNWKDIQHEKQACLKIVAGKSKDERTV